MQLIHLAWLSCPIYHSTFKWPTIDRQEDKMGWYNDPVVGFVDKYIVLWTSRNIRLYHILLNIRNFIYNCWNLHCICRELLVFTVHFPILVQEVVNWSIRNFILAYILAQLKEQMKYYTNGLIIQQLFSSRCSSIKNKNFHLIYNFI